MNKKRRIFLKQTGIAAAGMALLPPVAWSSPNGENKVDRVLKLLAAVNDPQVDDWLAKQLRKPGDRWDGGVVNQYQLPNAHSTKDFIARLAGAYASEFSRYYLSAQLEQPLERAIHCLARVQYEDGTIDLHSSNFHSTPDTAFLVNFLSPVYVVLKRLDRAGTREATRQLGQFILKAGECLLVGGIHTANHRWVVCSALARLHSFFPSPAYLDRMEEWLSEGIDMDPDGQYTERSVATYTPTIDNMFLTVGRLLDRPEFFEIVRKNLEMSLYYIQPGLEVLTDASGRQDSAQTRYVDGYYYAYRYLAVRDKNPVFAALCQQMEEQIPEKIADFTSLPTMLMEDPLFTHPLPAPGAIPVNYRKRFAHSGVFRIRRGQTDLSIIEHNPTFLAYRKGKAVLQSMRLHAAFFGSRGQFTAEETVLDGDKIILKRSKTHGYFQPFPADKRTGDGDWDKLPRDQREMTEVQTLNYRLAITETNGKVTVEIEIEGTDHVPVSLEMSFRKGGELSGVTPDTHNGEAYFLENGTGTYQLGKDTIRFGPGLAAHRWAQLRGMLPKQDGHSVYLTGYTPFRHTLVLS